MSESALDRSIEVAKILARQADQAETELVRVEDELAALRKRNRKLERVADAARMATKYRNTSSADPQGRYYVMARVPIDDLVDRLSDLDKEDATHGQPVNG